MSNCENVAILAIGEAMAEIRSSCDDGFSVGYAGGHL